MFSIILTGALMLTALVQSADTTISVERGMRLDLRNREGEIRVTTWQRDAVRIVAASASGLRIDAQLSGSVLRVRPSASRDVDDRTRRRRRRGIERRGAWELGDAVEFEVTVPAYLDIELSGVETEMTVTGTTGNISVETSEGAIVIRGGDGFVYARTSDGNIRIENARGRIEVSSSSGDLWVRDVSGEVTAETVDGDVSLVNVDSRQVTARTVDGAITFSGPVHARGRYRLSTHDGDVTVTIPQGTNATVSVANYEGDFETQFPVTLRGVRGHRIEFTLGDGSATLVLESFEGDVRLLRRR
jgi:hypothetical protein